MAGDCIENRNYYIEWLFNFRAPIPSQAVPHRTPTSTRFERLDVMTRA
jgi:hypothetical protein